MAGANSTEIVVAGTGKVWVAATTATMPTDATTALAAGWTDLGYTSEDGVTFTDSKDIADVGAWQSFYPVRKIVTGKQATVAFALRQWNKDTVPLAFGGGTISAAGAGKKYTPPSPDTIDSRAIVIEWTDGTKHYRLLVPNGLVQEAVETNLTRTAAGDLPITFAATPASASAAAYTLFTDDPSFV